MSASDPAPTGPQPRRWPTMLLGVYLVLLYAVLCLFAAIVHPETVPYLPAARPSATATIAPDPHILGREPSGEAQVTHEDFSSNKRLWGLYFAFGKVEVLDGRLVLQSNTTGIYALSFSPQLVLPEQSYYVQADFATDVNAFAQHGLVFGLNNSIGTYYLFEVSPRLSSFRLMKNASGSWSELLPLSRGPFRPYPAVNTLSVYFDRGQIEMYVNGQLVSTYLDEKPFQFTGVGVFAADAGFRLIVDDLFVYAEEHPDERLPGPQSGLEAALAVPHD